MDRIHVLVYENEVKIEDAYCCDCQLTKRGGKFPDDVQKIITKNVEAGKMVEIRPCHCTDKMLAESEVVG